MKTRVYITIDVEGREERMLGGEILPAAGYDLRVWCRYKNQSQDLGIDLIMRELETYGFKGTFYVDPIGSYSFGIDELAKICEEIQKRNHDLQLHLHPIQREARWWSLKKSAACDNMAEYSLDEQVSLIEEGCAILSRCGVPRQNVISLRAGHYAADGNTWRAMAKCGLRISSNHNYCHIKKGRCRLEWPDDVASLFQTDVGVWELPISNFIESRGDYRHFQITAISLDEMQDILLQAAKSELSHVTIVTHSFELAHLDSVPHKRGRLNGVNLRRLRGLAKFLAHHQDIFQVETVKELGQRIDKEKTNPQASLPQGKVSLKAGRLLQQIYKRIDEKIPLMEPISHFIVNF